MSSEKRSIDTTTVIVAVIGLVGTIAAALITVYATRTPPQPTATPPTIVVFTPTDTHTPVPTDTVPVGEPTSTPAPDTPTPTPTFTPVPTPAIGTDWLNGCISSLWTPYPSSIAPVVQDGCLSQPVDKFFASGGLLTFLYDGRVSSQEFYGLFALLPADGTASLNVSLTEISNGEIWMGVFDAPTIDANGMLLVIPDGNVKNRPVIQKAMPGQERRDSTQPMQSDPPVYGVVLDFNSGSIKASVPRIAYNFNSIAVPSAQKWLFVGYRVVSGSNRIEAAFSDLVITPR